MWNKPTQKQLAKIPMLYDTEHVCIYDKIIYMHFFLGACDWYIAEFDGNDIFFGYVNLGDDIFAEWGYISLNELCEIRKDYMQVDRDLHWKPCRFGEIKKQCVSN